MIWPRRTSVKSACRNERLALRASPISAFPSLSDWQFLNLEYSGIELKILNSVLKGSGFSAFWNVARRDPNQTTALWPFESESRDQMMQRDSAA